MTISRLPCVVYHYNPTSNRNWDEYYWPEFAVVYHYNPTSNRNSALLGIDLNTVVYHYNPTSNRNDAIPVLDTAYVVYHYNPTSNRNYQNELTKFSLLYIIIILHQTATLDFLFI